MLCGDQSGPWIQEESVLMDDGDGPKSRGGNGQDEGRGDRSGSVCVWLTGRSSRGSDSITTAYIVRVPKPKESDLCLV